MPVTKPLGPQQRRAHTGLDVKIQFDCDISTDFLFTNKEKVLFLLF